MKSSPSSRSIRVRTPWRATIAAALVAAGFAPAACLDRPLCAVHKGPNSSLEEECKPLTTELFVDTLPGGGVDKIDLLFMIDNSSSMADKQNVLASAVPDLVDRFVNPFCVDGQGGQKAVGSADDPCPPGSQREFPAVKDIHVGVITSSLGGHGSSSCTPDPTTTPTVQEEQDDHAHLVGARPRAAGLAQAAGGFPPDKLGFLDWNPKQSSETVSEFKATFQAMVPVAGDSGCGYEAQLEAVYRFLSDPAPPAQITTGPCSSNPRYTCASVSGVDQEILAERRAFLRPDSLVAVVALTDENDCSIQEGGQSYLIAEPSFVAANASSACGTNPNDPCCYSCGLAAPPKGCAPDPACAAPPPKDATAPNLRCFDQKRRFGVDFLYPTARYVNALTKPALCITRTDLSAEGCPAQEDGTPGLVENPLFSDLTGSGAPRRPSDDVFFAGILGVPWQDIQATVDGAGHPIPNDQLVYKSAADMAVDGTWDRILGNPRPPGGAPPEPPIDPHMIEATAPRPGLPGPNASYMADAINGHDWAIKAQNDLEYACIFPLVESAVRECAANAQDCDCGETLPGDDNPLCQAPDGSYGTRQYFAKGYPGLRELEVLHGVGENAIVASICARELRNTARSDYGYRPAVSAIVERLKDHIRGKCLPRKLTRVDGDYPCSVLEATPNPKEANCAARPGRSVPNGALVEPAREQLRAGGNCDDDPTTPLPDCSAMHFCEIKEAGPTCLRDTPDQTDVGWCYVDPSANEGDSSLVEQCPPNEQRILRFVDPDHQTPVHDGTILIACVGAAVTGEP